MIHDQCTSINLSMDYLVHEQSKLYAAMEG